MSTTARRPYVAATAALALALGAGACSGGDEERDRPGAQPSDTATHAPAVETVVRFGQVTGKLPPRARDRVSAQVAAVVDGWTEAAYLGSDYPRRDFSDSWPGFTAGARAEARRDRALMSNADIGERIDGAAARQRRVRLDVLAVHGRAVGVTARVFLEFRTTGRLARDVRVAGRLYLTHAEGGWRVFGYDVTKGAV